MFTTVTYHNKLKLVPLFLRGHSDSEFVKAYLSCNGSQYTFNGTSLNQR